MLRTEHDQTKEQEMKKKDKKKIIKTNVNFEEKRI